jgi:hypothetical protein
MSDSDEDFDLGEEEDYVVDDDDVDSDVLSLDEEDSKLAKTARDDMFESVDRAAQGSGETDYIILTLKDVVQKQQVH